MSLISKFQNLFTEEVDEPIKSEVIQIEIPAPEKAEEKNVSDNQTISIEEKTPVFFNDDDFKELEKPKEIKSSYIKEKPVIKKEEKKVFKPTPIISPVYGVLNKNYHKEDITDKKTQNNFVNPASLDFDEVRKKAYGTLETDLEDTLFGSKAIIFDDIVDTKPKVIEEEMFDELTDVIDFDDNILDESIGEDKINSEDLFDLIDSMYERGE